MARNERTIELKVSGMSCEGCVQAVEQALRSVAGVQAVTVNLETGLAKVQVMPPDIPADNLIKAIRMAGYDAEEVPVA